jgi:hypothetical protein
VASRNAGQKLRAAHSSISIAMGKVPIS